MTRMQKKRLLSDSRKIKCVQLLLVLITVFFLYGEYAPAAVPVMAARDSRSTLLGAVEWREVLFAGLPYMAALKEGHGEADGRGWSANYQAALRRLVYLTTDIDVADISSVLHAQLPLAPETGRPAAVRSEESRVRRPQFFSVVELPNGEPVVAIYHTHTAESFIPTTGMAHSPGGQTGEICNVGAVLADNLSRRKIAAIHDTTIHDYPSFMKAYGASEVTVKRLVEEYPQLQIVIDLHRDAQKRAEVTTQINGAAVAQICFVVAQGQEDLPQPHWQENHAMAQLINDRCAAKYPGLSKGIQLVEWRYNQHLHPHALLIEVGSHESSSEEAQRAMVMLADVLAEILQQ